MEQSAASSQSQTDLNTDDIKSEFMTLLNTLSAFKSQITMISSQVKSLEKKVKKRMKALEKQANKNKNKKTVRLLDLQFPLLFQRIYVNSWINQKEPRWRELKLPNILFNTLKTITFLRVRLSNQTNN